MLRITFCLVGVILAGVISAQAQMSPLIQWQKSFGGTGDDLATAVKQTTDGGYIIGGPSASGISGNKTNGGFGSYDYWIVKVNAAGQKEWDKSFGGSGGESLEDLQQTADGGYILGGYSDSEASGNKTNASFNSSDYWIVKLDAAGNKEWDRSFGGTGQNAPYKVKQTKDGGYIVGGLSDSDVSGNKTSSGFGYSDFWIAKLDGSGNRQWDKSYGGNGIDVLYELQETSDCGYILGGHSDSEVSGNKTTGNFGFRDYWLVKLVPPPQINFFRLVQTIFSSRSPRDRGNELHFPSLV